MSIPRTTLARVVTIAAATAIPAAAITVGASPAGALPMRAGASGATQVVVADDLRGQDAVTVARETLAALRRGDRVGYDLFRGRLARLVAPAAGVDANHLDVTWSRADARRMTAVVSALTQLGVPYHRRSAAPGQGFDCSGLTSWAWSQSGLGLPHQSGRQIRGVTRVGLEQVLPGDLLYYPGHVMLALGIGGAMVHAPNTGNVVEVRMLSDRQQRRLRVGDPLA